MNRSSIPTGATVVIPTLNRGSYLLDTVRDLLSQDHSPLEILIVDQSDITDPDLMQIVEAHPEVFSYHRVSFRGLPVARNFGWQMARNEIVIYVDDDIRCDHDFVSAHVIAQQNAGEALIGGRIIEAADETRNERTGGYSKWMARTTAAFHIDKDCQVDHVKGANFSCTRTLLAEVGGLDEALGIGAAVLEETELSLAMSQLGNQNLFCAGADLEHLAAGSGGTRQRDMSTYVYALMHNRSILIRRYSAWYQYPSALAWSAKLVAAFTVSYRQPGIMLQGVLGMYRGWLQAKRPRICSDFAGGGR